MGALFLLVIPLTLYWACNEQQGNTIALWSMDNTDRAVISWLAWQIPWTWFQSFNPVRDLRRHAADPGALAASGRARSPTAR